jgi:hypothetical protein
VSVLKQKVAENEEVAQVEEEEDSVFRSRRWVNEWSIWKDDDNQSVLDVSLN